MREVEIPLYSGWVEANIHLLLHDHPQLIGNFPWALVTSLDSSLDIPAMPSVQKALEKTATKSFELGKSLVVSGSDLVEMETSYELFFGFDELWLFREYPIQLDLPGAWIVAPRDLSEGIPSQVEEWTLESRCVLGLGDGIGLNYITVDEEIAAQLETLEARS